MDFILLFHYPLRRTKFSYFCAFKNWCQHSQNQLDFKFITLDGRDFYILNADGDEVVAATDNVIAPMQGLFVLAGEFEEEVVFTTTAPAKGKALKMSITCDLDASTGSAATVIDNATIRFGEGRSLEKFQLNPSHSKLYLMQDNKAYAVVQSDAQGEMVICFKAEKDGTYTLNFSNEEVTFGYLHLIDSLTGEDVDLLHSSMQAEQSYPDQPVSYTFTAKTTDNANRFRLVFY